MNRSDLVKRSRNWRVETNTARVEEMVSIVLDEIVRAVDAGERVELRGFGSFFPRQRRFRMGRNPRTGESVSVPAKRVLFFKAGRDLVQRLNGKKVGRRWTDEE